MSNDISASIDVLPKKVRPLTSNLWIRARALPHATCRVPVAIRVAGRGTRGAPRRMAASDAHQTRHVHGPELPLARLSVGVRLGAVDLVVCHGMERNQAEHDNRATHLSAAAAHSHSSRIT